jgi:hypothetical protein
MGRGVGPDFGEDLKEIGVAEGVISILSGCTAQRAERRPSDANALVGALDAAVVDPTPPNPNLGELVAQGSFPSWTQSMIEGQLQPKEHAVWIGKPDPQLYAGWARSAGLGAMAAIVSLIIGLVAAAGWRNAYEAKESDAVLEYTKIFGEWHRNMEEWNKLSAEEKKGKDPPSPGPSRTRVEGHSRNAFEIVMPTAGGAGFAIGLAIFYAWVSVAVARAKKIIYVLTSKRCIVFNGTSTTGSYSIQDLGKITRVSSWLHGPDAGDLVIPGSPARRGLYGIRNLFAVENKIRAVVAKAKK